MQHATNPLAWQLEGFKPYAVNNAMTEAPTETYFEFHELVGGSIPFSEFATSTAQTDGDASELDTWTVHISGDHSSASPPYTSVGMILSYNQDRMEPVTPDADSTVTGPNNPLALLRSQSLTGGAVADIAEDQELTTPPYDLVDEGDSIEKTVLDFVRVYPYSAENSSFALQKISNVFLPC